MEEGVLRAPGLDLCCFMRMAGDPGLDLGPSRRCESAIAQAMEFFFCNGMRSHLTTFSEAPPAWLSQ